MTKDDLVYIDSAKLPTAQFFQEGDICRRILDEKAVQSLPGRAVTDAEKARSWMRPCRCLLNRARLLLECKAILAFACIHVLFDILSLLTEL